MIGDNTHGAVSGRDGHRGTARGANGHNGVMWIVVIAWMYVAVMMAVAEASNPQGSVLGGVITLLLYGVAPLALVLYLLNTPMRRRRLSEQAPDADLASGQAPLQAHPGAAAIPAPDSPPGSAPAESASSTTLQPDACRLPAGDAIAPERKEP